ncbi:hypothetical protein BDP27DRAFT_725442 [Rhodocollybia butyracea]|uniref:Uncharacterized protein n=1 Tax=Rhodocollybia butyracea TaxID=206335 RepID=A0A9P5U8X1_9AGAR|nr:hypothetical protein BDP27DRAFT_725442 [Rhodocollybia butyracea]
MEGGTWTERRTTDGKRWDGMGRTVPSRTFNFLSPIISPALVLYGFPMMFFAYTFVYISFSWSFSWLLISLYRLSILTTYAVLPPTNTYQYVISTLLTSSWISRISLISYLNTLLNLCRYLRCPLSHIYHHWANLVAVLFCTDKSKSLPVTWLSSR